MPKIVKMNDIDAVKEFLLGNLGEGEMSAEQLRKLDRVLMCDDLIRHHGSVRKVIPILVRMVKNKYPKQGYTTPTARIDFQDTQAIIGSTYKFNRDYNVAILLEEMAETRLLAKMQNDAKAMAACDKNKAMVIEKFMGDADIPAYDELNPKPLEIGFFPELLKADVPRLANGFVDEKALEKELAELRKVKREDDEDYQEIEVLK